MENFDLGKFISSFFQVVPWIKNVRFVVGALGIGFVALTLYRAYFMPTTKQVTHIIAQSGAQVTVDQKREEKKAGIEVHPFVEGYGFAESDNRKGVGGKAGLRVEF